MKYDLLTALGAFALSADKHTQRRILRLITLITARYNWAQDEVTVGRTEMAQLWGVTERQVKRELGALKTMGFLKLKRAGARGRVSAYQLGMSTILESTAAAWTNVGPDFAERMEGHAAGGQGPQGAASDGQRSIIPFPGSPRETSQSKKGQSDAAGAEEWMRIRRALELENRAIFTAWFAPLQQKSFAGGRLMLRAPTPFHADYVSARLLEPLRRAALKAAPEVQQVEVIA